MHPMTDPTAPMPDWKTRQMIKASGWPLAPELLEPGADFHAPAEGGLVPFHWACTEGKAGVLKYMLEHGAYAAVRLDGRFGTCRLPVTGVRPWGARALPRGAGRLLDACHGLLRMSCPHAACRRARMSANAASTICTRRLARSGSLS